MKDLSVNSKDLDITTYTAYEYEQEIKKFNWGAFFLTWIWGLGNNVIITLLMFIAAMIPIVGFFLSIIFSIWFGIKGNEWAIKSKTYKNLEHFRKVQRIWAFIGTSLFLSLLIISIFAVLYTFNAIIKPELIKTGITIEDIIREAKTGNINLKMDKYGQITINNKNIIK